MRSGADSAVRSLTPGLRISIGTGGPSLRPMMWMFIAILATFLITRTVTRLIRSGSGAGAGLGNVRLAGVHIHHQVFGILIIIGTGIVLVSATPHGAALEVAAAIFGVGVSLTLDEFALWLHLEDVYWTTEGRKSVDAIFCVLVVTGALVGGTSFLAGRVGTAGSRRGRPLPGTPALAPKQQMWPGAVTGRTRRQAAPADSAGDAGAA